MTNNLYSIKIIYKYTVTDKENHTFFEEQIITVKTSSFDDAYKKAEEFANQQCDEYLSIENCKIKIEIYSLADCFLVYIDDYNDICEVYSCIKRNTTCLTDKQYADELSKQCSADEMYILRHN